MDSVVSLNRPAVPASPNIAGVYQSATIGKSAPLGATPIEGGVNFSISSRQASAVELLFFNREDDSEPSRVIRLDPYANRTYHYWHVFVPEVEPGQIYGYRVGDCSTLQMA
jgi:isoamylase